MRYIISYNQQGTSYVDAKNDIFRRGAFKVEKSPYYAITVRRYNILFRHIAWLQETQELYNEILLFYYRLYLDFFSEKQPGALETLRTLEKMTIPGRDKQPVPYPLPWQKVPLYFRRAAINAAIAAARSYLARTDQASPTEHFTESVTFYKGMYRDYQESEISLKLWTGAGWKWCRLRLRSNTAPTDGQMMSPSLVRKDNSYELHVPWKTPVQDGRNLKARLESGEKICAAVFTGQDACIVCCILNGKGEWENCLFVKGGSKYAHACRQLWEKIDKSRSSGSQGNDPRANHRYWMKLKNLHEHYAHQFSRQVIDYCQKHNVSILVLPEYDKEYARIIYGTAGPASPLRLSNSIREKLKYKGWQQGIVTIEVQQHDISSTCALCGGKITQKKKGAEFICENGHRGNIYLNMAHNLGKKAKPVEKSHQ